MNIKLGMLATAGLIATVGLTFGCGDSASTGGAGGTGTTTTTGVTSSSKATTATGTATSSSTGGANDCANYCATIAANCTAANSQFADTATCMTACMPLTPGTPGATSGNTLACHIYHATAAMGAGADVHCWHAAIPSHDNVDHAKPGPCL